MELHATHVFEAPIERVWAMFRDVESHVAKFTGMGHRELEVLEYTADDDHARIVISRLVDVDLPGFARKVLKPTNTVVSTDEWHRTDDGYRGTYVVETKGAPVDVRGTTFIRPEGDDRTFYETSVAVKVNVPLIGGKIADWARSDGRKQIDEEFAAGDRWLAEHP